MNIETLNRLHLRLASALEIRAALGVHGHETPALDAEIADLNAQINRPEWIMQKPLKPGSYQVVIKASKSGGIEAVDAAGETVMTMSAPVSVPSTLARYLAEVEEADAALFKIQQAADKLAGKEGTAVWWGNYCDAYDRLRGPEAFATLLAAEAEVVTAYRNTVERTLSPAQCKRSAPIFAAALARRGFERSRVLAAARQLVVSGSAP